MVAPIKLSELIEAFEWVSSVGAYENAAYIHRDSGTIYWSSDTLDNEEDLPEDVEDNPLYIPVPGKNDLDLGRSLALRFIEDVLPDSYDLAYGFFRKRGAYARFKDFLERKGCLESWYEYEAKAVEQALREWCEEHGLQLSA